MQANHLQAQRVARELLRLAGPACLATLAADGAPFASYVISAPDTDGAPILLLSALAAHTANLKRDKRASLLKVRGAADLADASAAQRLTVGGDVGEHPDKKHAAALFLACHPAAAGYAGLADFRYFRLEPASGHLVAGFGLIAALSRGDLLPV